MKSQCVTTTPDPMEEPQQAPLNDKTNMAFITTVDIQGQLFTDQTGRFPLNSNRGNNYVVIFTQLMQTTSSLILSSHVTDPNSFVPTMMCIHTCVCKDIDHSYTNLTMNPLMMWKHSSPRIMQASNTLLLKFIEPTSRNVPSKLGKTILFPCDQVSPNLTASPTDLKQTDITLNMMCPCTQNPNLLAHEALEGMFSFDATPMAPIGTECMIYIKTSSPQTWVYHAIKGTKTPSMHQSHCGHWSCLSN
ncbi:LOW QUALITY PROTEIN: hypothetical protein ACHAW6_005129 [Cyclotella cf. meneghiniana]